MALDEEKRKEYMKEYNKKYREKNKEKIKSYSQSYYKNNKEKKQKYTQEYQKQNKETMKKYRREYYENNKETRKKYWGEYYENNKETIKNRVLKRKYSITLSDYNIMVQQQHNKCAICGQEKKLLVDHSHHNGMVRNLLCGNCNSAIGLLKESPEILQNAIDYLVKWESMEETG